MARESGEDSLGELVSVQLRSMSEMSAYEYLTGKGEIIRFAQDDGAITGMTITIDDRAFFLLRRYHCRTRSRSAGQLVGA